MNNSFKDKNLDKVSLQLALLEDKKSKITKNIYREYLIYLEIIRKTLFSSVEKGIYGLSYSLSTNHVDNNSKIECSSLKKNINLIIREVLPFITIEQLYLSDLNNSKDCMEEYEVKEINDFQEHKFNQIDNEKNYIKEETLQFEFNNNISNNYNYYQSISKDEISSINLDIVDFKDNIPQPENLLSNDNEKQFFISLLELAEESNTVKLKGYENKGNHNENVFIPIKISNIINWFELIDESLNKLLLKFSHKINLELFKKQLIKKIISEDSFLCLASKSFMIKHPYPYVIEFDLNSNNFLTEKIKLPKINLINISNIELEFCNINLISHRNNINALKKELKLLLKKQRYWKKKKLNSKNFDNKLKKL